MILSEFEVNDFSSIRSDEVGTRSTLRSLDIERDIIRTIEIRSRKTCRGYRRSCKLPSDNC